MQATSAALEKLIKQTNAKVLTANSLARELSGNQYAKQLVEDLVKDADALEKTVPVTRNLMLFRKFAKEDYTHPIQTCGLKSTICNLRTIPIR